MASTDLIERSWDRIDAWLQEHAPRTFASLAPPATDEEMRAAQEELDLSFHPDLVASLRRHNGARGDAEAAFRFATHDRLLAVREIVEATRFLRDIAADLYDEDEDEDEDEAEAAAEGYWHHGYVQFGSYEATADGLTVDCRTGHDAYGAIGRFFDEEGTGFGHAPSLGACLAALADTLEQAGTAPDGGDSPVVFNGRLIWASARTPGPAWGSAADPLPAATTDLPPLELPADPAQPIRAVYMTGLQELGALVATLPRERVAEAARRQMRRLATETGLAMYAEVTAALDAQERGEDVPRDRNGPLGLRLRAVIAEAAEHRDDFRRWAAEALPFAVWGLPPEAVSRIATARSHLSVHWRTELLADLGNPPLPDLPDNLFWARLSNPDIDTGWYEAQYAQVLR